jgi:hypothetical protein
MAEQAHEMGLEIREGTPGSEHDRAMVATADARTRDFEDHRPARLAQPGVA